MFLNYVLHPRVNEEELCDCRGFFYAQIRGRIEGLSAREAILAINEWNAEQVCYRATDERTISALGAWRSGFGRCGEESTFAVNVLRAAGIPARQVYTPRWAHCDDNHAWVEAYCGGAWHFFGACEPEEALDRGWFTGAASRALLVHSRCFGTPAADEEIISVDGAVTFLNQTARYAPVRLLAVRVREKDGRPAAGAEVTFGILNASEVFPAAVIRTDADGMARLRCGYGDLIVQARKNGLCRETLCPASQEEPLELTLAEPEAPAGRWTSFTLHAPKERLPERSAPTPAQRAAATEKQAAADEKRRLRLEAAYDAARIRALRERFGYGAQAEAILRAACGNFAALAELLEDPAYPAPRKLALLQTLGEKDLRDVRPAVLREALDAGGGVSPSDEFSMQYLLCPRIGTEPLSCWRRTLADSFPEARKREFREAPDALWRWIRESIRQAPQTEYRQLVTLPAGAMRLRCADLPSQRLLFVAVCRTLGIPARLNPAGGAAEYALDGQFFSPEAGRTANARLQLQKQPGETWQPGADFGLSAFENGAWQPMAVPGQWDGARLTLAIPGRLPCDHGQPPPERRPARHAHGAAAGGGTGSLRAAAKAGSLACGAGRGFHTGQLSGRSAGRPSGRSGGADTDTVSSDVAGGGAGTDGASAERAAEQPGAACTAAAASGVSPARQTGASKRKAAGRACRPCAGGGLVHGGLCGACGAQRLCGAGQAAACSAVRRPAPYSPRLCRVPRRQRRYRAGLLPAGPDRTRINHVLDRIQISDSPDRPLGGTGCFADIKRDFLVKLFILREKSACHPEGSMVNYPCGKSFCFPAMAMHL
ncbi:MAG: transglutaminase domain-containing protein [Oscillospiraceae bacterium]